MKNNKGFSLVELIIVIAIMAILVGVMAPQLIKYIEKTNVSADVQLCDSVQTAITLALTDPDVLSATDNSQNQLSTLTDGGAHDLDMFGGVGTGNTVFTRAVIDVLGFNPFRTNIQQQQMKSSPASDSGDIYVQVVGSSVYVWINHSDMSGQKENNTCNSYTALESSGVIYVE